MSTVYRHPYDLYHYQIFGRSVHLHINADLLRQFLEDERGRCVSDLVQCSIQATESVIQASPSIIAIAKMEPWLVAKPHFAWLKAFNRYFLNAVSSPGRARDEVLAVRTSPRGYVKSCTPLEK